MAWKTNHQFWGTVQKPLWKCKKIKTNNLVYYIHAITGLINKYIYHKILIYIILEMGQFFGAVRWYVIYIQLIEILHFIGTSSK